MSKTRALGLALSGGGLRATLFHPGVVAFLRDHDLLPEVGHIASVSGGSILAAHLVQHWDRYLDEDLFKVEAKKLAAFAKLDVRGRCLRRLPSYLPLLLLPRRLGGYILGTFERPSSLRNVLLVRHLKRLFGDKSLAEIARAQPAAPNLDILATNLTQGTLAVFSRDSFIPSQETGHRIEARVGVATAVAISASFPLFFPPRRFSANDLGVLQGELQVPPVLTDAGVFDNLGLSRLQALLEEDRDAFDWIIVSDATGAFDWEVDTDFSGLFQAAVRSSDVLMKRIGDLQVVSARDDPVHRFLRISDPRREQIEPHGRPVPKTGVDGGEGVPASPLADLFVRRQLTKVRTDLDGFSKLEIRALFHHGYSVAAEQLADLTEGCRNSPPWYPAAETHHEKSGSVKRVAAVLRASHQRKFRFFSLTDWISYAHAAVVAAMIFALSFLVLAVSEREDLLEAFATAPKDSFGILERCEDIEDLYAGFGSAQAKWRGNVSVQVAAAVVAASRNEPTNESRCKFGDEELVPVRATLERLAELDKRRKRFTDDERFHFHRLSGYVALRDANSASSNSDWKVADDRLTAARRQFETAWLHRGKGLYRLEYYLCSTLVERVEMLKVRLSRVSESPRRERWKDAAELRGREAELHCERSLEFSVGEQRIAYWPAHLLKGKLYYLKATLSADDTARERLLENAADQITKAHSSIREPGDESYFQALDSYIPGVAELCRFERFREELEPFCID